MKNLISWARQPSTLMAGGIVVAGVIYYCTGSAELAGAGAAVLLGSVSDHTAQIIARVELLEDFLKGGNQAGARK